jgi:hypothetical protein
LNAVIGNKLLVWGGFPNSDEIQDGAIFDLDKNAWEVMPGAPIYFMYGMVSAVWRDRFVVFGRWEARGGATFDPNSCTWEEIQEAPFDIPRQGACAVNADKLFLWSGSESKTKEGAVYDFVRREWNRIPAAPIPDRCLGFASPFGSKVVVWGGWRAERALPDGAIFDLESQTWKAIAELPGEISPEFHPGW